MTKKNFTHGLQHLLAAGQIGPREDFSILQNSTTLRARWYTFHVASMALKDQNTSPAFRLDTGRATFLNAQVYHLVVL